MYSNVPVRVVPFENVDPLPLHQVHGLPRLRHEGGQRVEDVALFHIECCGCF